VEKIEASTGNAKVTDYRRKLDNGSDNPNYGKEVNVPYDVAAFDVVSTFDEVTKEFSQAQLISMAQSRQKATANSAARQKAVSIYAPTGDDLARENFIKSAMQMNSKLTREQAEAFADSMLATA
jgi:hypothetical protein